MKKRLVLLLFFVLITSWSVAQRFTDHLDRGLVAVQATDGIYLSWRILAEEYYDVSYNLYRDGVKINEHPLNVSNFIDRNGTLSSSYYVTPIIDDVEGEKCKSVTAWPENYKELTLSTIIGSDGTDVTSHYEPNDICPADVDGDGEVELIVKRLNIKDYNDLFPDDNRNFTRIEVYKLDGTLLWWIDVGPNMFSMFQMETNAIAYDWDEDGCAEIMMRVEDGAVVHTSSGEKIAIGDTLANYRSTIAWRGSSNCYETQGTEYLIYLNGKTGEVYDNITYPLPRNLLELSNTSGWGDNYGHRANKHFYAAPFLDGKHASAVFCRGIYTAIFMKAYDIDRSTHKLKPRWYWVADGNYYGQGFHNFGIADVDLDGRDEIVYGSMVVDDNGKGLSTTGRGHGDAQHCGDLDPYRKGLEIYTCHETRPGSMLRNATTSEIYYTVESPNDDGRAMAGNFTNNWPGCQIESARTNGLVSSVSDKWIASQEWSISMNMRIYWDGDLCEETFDYSGMSEDGYSYGINGHIRKYLWTDSWVFTGTRTNNSTKGSPCLIGDILGDWREEILLRTGDGKLRIYTTTEETEWRQPSLWYDHQYRQGMLWEQMGYNQPPHTSFFLGKLEGYTMAPPPLTLTGRTLVGNGGSIKTTKEHLLVYDTKDIIVNIEDGASPKQLFVNTPSWVQGNNSSGEDGLTKTYYTTTLTGGRLTGKTRLIKQGDGILNLPSVCHTYSGKTEIWNGRLNFSGTLENSELWMNRHTTLSSSGTFRRPMRMEYGSTLHVGEENKIGATTIDTLSLGIGSRLKVEFDKEGNSDTLSIKILTIETKSWEHGPTYLSPVIEICGLDGAEIPSGVYKIADVDSIKGTARRITVEGVELGKAYIEDGQLLVEIVGKFISSTESSEPCAEERFYLYNTSTGKYYYGAVAPAQLSEAPEYFLLFQGKKRYSMYGDNGYIKTGYWMDIFSWPDGVEEEFWTFDKVNEDENIYTIYSRKAITDSPITASKKWYLTIDNGYASATCDTVGDPSIYWKLISHETVIENESEYIRYRIENDLTPYESGKQMVLGNWITNGTSLSGNGDNIWYLDGEIMVKWGENTQNFAYKKLKNMPAGKYKLSMFVRSVSGQQLFMSGADTTGGEDYAVLNIPDDGNGAYQSITFVANEPLETLCFGIRDNNPAAFENYWCCFNDVKLTYTPFVTDIEEVETDDINVKRTGIYDLTGRKLEQCTRKGIYIINGEKVVIK